MFWNPDVNTIEFLNSFLFECTQGIQNQSHDCVIKKQIIMMLFSIVSYFCQGQLCVDRSNVYVYKLQNLSQRLGEQITLGFLHLCMGKKHWSFLYLAMEWKESCFRSNLWSINESFQELCKPWVSTYLWRIHFDIWQK